MAEVVVNDAQSERIPAETALLIASATGKGIDVSLWLTDGKGDGKVPKVDFNAKLIGLGIAVAAGEDEETNEEIGIATSSTSLEVINDVVACPRDLGLIDVQAFLQLCNRKLEVYLNEMNINVDLENHDATGDNTYLDGLVSSSLAPVSTSVSTTTTDGDAALRMPSNDDVIESFNASAAFASARDAIVSSSLKAEAEAYMKEAKQWTGEVDRPVSAPSGRTKSGFASNTGGSATTRAAPSATLGALVSKSRGVTLRSHSASTTTTAAAVRKAETKEKNKSLPPQSRPQLARPQSAPSRRKASEPTAGAPAMSSSLEMTDTGSAAHQEIREYNRPPKISPGPDKMSQFEDVVEDMIRCTVKQSDLYHYIQVHLGFIDRYTMIPHRGPVITSRPRLWLSVQDLQDAFYYGRLRLATVQVIVLMKLVLAFAVSTQLNSVDTAATDDHAHETPLNKQEDANEKAIDIDAAIRMSLQRPVKIGKKLLLKKEYGDSVTPTLSSTRNTVIPARAPTEEQTADVSRAVVSNGKISAEWLKRYLVHLRLTPRNEGVVEMRRQAAASSVWSSDAWLLRKSAKASPAASIEATVTRSSSAPRASRRYSHLDSRPHIAEKRSTAAISSASVGRKPVDFDIWLRRKEEDGQVLLDHKSRDFRRALAGKYHSLNEDDINHALEKLEIVPPEIMKAVVDCKTQNWVHDADGRRDFSHALHIEVRKWQSAHKGEKCDADKKSSLRHKLIRERCDFLSQCEVKDAVITKELYWKFDSYCRSSNFSSTLAWGAWLKRYVTKEEAQLVKLKEFAFERLRAESTVARHKQAVAALSELESKLSTAAKSLASQQSVELKKSLLALRKAALETCGYDKGGRKADVSGGGGEVLDMAARRKALIVSKSDFDRYFKEVLASPHLKHAVPKELLHMSTYIPPPEPKTAPTAEALVDNEREALAEMRPKTTAISADDGKGKEEPGTASALFTADKCRALDRYAALEETKNAKTLEDFKSWSVKKKQEKLERAAKEAQEKRDREQKEAQRLQEARKTYRRWKKLHKENKYVSRIDGRGRSIPSAAIVEHKARWRPLVEPPQTTSAASTA